MSDYDDDFESEGSPVKSTRSSIPPSSSGVPSSRVSAKPAPVVHASRPPPAKSGASKPVRTSSAPRSAAPPDRRRPSPAEKQRSASSLGRRVMNEPSALVPLSNEERTEMDELRRINLQLRSELLDLNRRLDEQLGQRGQKVSRVHAVPKGAAMLPSDKIAQKNEIQRKINAELRDQLQRPHMQLRVSEAANAVGHEIKLLEAAMSEAKGLENVQAHQLEQLERIRIVEQEMQTSKSEHNEQLRIWKDQTKSFKESREQDMTIYSKVMRQVERLEEKLRVQDEVGAAVKSVKDVTEQVDERDRMIDALKYQVAVLSKTNSSDKKRAKAVNDRVTRELHSLREESESLRKQVKALGLAGELGVDTRM